MCLQTAVLIVHGGFMLPPIWTPFRTLLETAGYVTSCPHLPTCSNTRPPTATFADDVAAVRAAATELAAAGHPIIVMSHSWGGLVASEAITTEFYAANTGEGSGGVVAMIYISAWMLLPDTNLTELFENYGFKSIIELNHNEDGSAWPKNPIESFFNDIEPEQARNLAREGVLHNWSATGANVMGTPWRDVKTVYVYCEKDTAVFPELQRSMVQDAKAGGGRAIMEKSVDTGHCPFLSRPQEVVTIVGEITQRLG